MQFSFKDFKDRHLYRTAVGYAVAAWIILQVAAIVLPVWNAPPWMMKALIGAILFGFVVALLIDWRDERSRAAGGPVTAAQRRRLALAAVALLPAIAVALGFLIFYHPTPPEARRQTGTAAEKSIAVLPFANLSKNEENAF